MLRSRAVALFVLSGAGIYDVLARSISEFSNTLEDLSPRFAEVPCFAVPFGGGSGASAPERDHCRGWRHLAVQFARGRGGFFSDVLRSRAVASPSVCGAGIYGVLARSISAFRNTAGDGGS